MNPTIVLRTVCKNINALIAIYDKNIFNQARGDDVYNDKSTLKTVPFVVDTSDGKNLPPDVQTNQQNNTGILHKHQECATE